MRSLQLQTVLREFVEAAAVQLQADVDGGAEVPFELAQRGRRASPTGPALYCYQPLTEVFIAERAGALASLAAYRPAVELLERFEGLGRYVAGSEDEDARADTRRGAGAALERLLTEVFREQTDFELRPERLQAALEKLERSAAPTGGESTLVAALHGMAISAEELPLTSGLTIARPDALDGMPPALAGSGCELVVAFTLEQEDPARALAHGVEVLRELLRALRLFGDGRLCFGPIAWAQIDGGPWSPVAMGAGGRPHGMLVVAAAQEDELRAFCNLVSRRAPSGDEVAWALRRYELGCERGDAGEALSDHLLALRALLEPEGPATGLMAARLAALCATPEQRLALTERAVAAIELERALIAGPVGDDAALEPLAHELARHLRSLLRDVICGHLTTDLVGLADELLLEDDPRPAGEGAEPAQAAPQAEEDAWELEEAFAEGLAQALIDPRPPRRQRLVRGEEERRRAADEVTLHATRRGRGSAEQVAGDAGESLEVLDLLI